MAVTKTARASVVFAVTGGESEAEKIARVLVDEKLAACANIIGPVRSIYRWRAKVEDAREYLIMIKTRASLYSRVERRGRARALISIGSATTPMRSRSRAATEPDHESSDYSTKFS